MKHTGKEWNDIINIPNGLTICDPDGFDRTNNSYEEKRISRREFYQRNYKCTLVNVNDQNVVNHAVFKYL